MNEKNPGNQKSESRVKTVFVDGNGQVTIICTICGKSKTVSATYFPPHQRRYTIRCSCLNRFEIRLEYRKTYRKATNLQGTLNAGIDEGELKTKIRNLSQGGICLEVDNPHSMHINQKGTVEFTLDDKKRTRLRKQFTIRSILDSWIGCEFNQDKAYEKDLGFYLRV